MGRGSNEKEERTKQNKRANQSKEQHNRAKDKKKERTTERKKDRTNERQKDGKTERQNKRTRKRTKIEGEIKKEGQGHWKGQANSCRTSSGAGEDSKKRL